MTDNRLPSKDELSEGLRIMIYRLEFDRRVLLDACKAAVADAEKAVNPSARLYGYDKFKVAIQKVEGKQ